jgi:hypothetical protein
MVRVRRGLRPTLVAQHEQPLKSAGAGHWSAPLEVMSELLAEADGAALRVVLADCWVRFAVVPWADSLSSSQERLGHGRQLLESIYGDAVSGWEVSLSAAPLQSPCIACSMPSELLAQLTAIAFKHGVRLASLQPQLIAAYGNWRQSLPASGAWFVTVGDGTLAAARLAKSAWDRVHSVRIGQDWVRELNRLQTFGRLASASPDDGKVYVDAPQAWREVAGPAGADLQWLEDEPRSLTTLQRLARVRRLAA